ncbi:MAG TPA: beta-ketoacyl-ACP synthase II [Myxococcota bacterium]|jgi:3-oxoacyl-[acyl-carrier-protein] synthase II|nr:beta-ketoacyl-ACP synthase II [Myxococcota bacterium]
MENRVAITGIGLVTPLGNDLPTTWDGIVKGRSGIAPIAAFDATPFRTHFGGEVKGFDATKFIDKVEARHMDRYAHFAIVAAEEALRDSGFVVTPENAENVGVLLGVGLGGLQTLEDNHRALLERGAKRMNPFMVPMMIANIAPGIIAIRVGAKGPNYTLTSACASAAHSIGDSAELIKSGVCEAVITGGSEAALTRTGVGGFCAMRALSTRNEEPARASRPFDKGRDGFVIAEGAGLLVLENLENARKRGAHIYAEVVGYGRTCDAHHITAPDPVGDGAARAMKMALRLGRVDPERVGYVNAHGTSTEQGDVAETIALKSVFGDYAKKKLMVSSTKSMTGHTLGAAGGLETAFTALALHHGVLPPTINYEEPDPACDLDYVPNTAREVKIDYAMNNSFGFGGTNVSLVLRRFNGA